MPKLSQFLEQKQHLSPQQILEANIMQLNLISLEKKIIEELESNPLLEIIEDNDKEISDDLNEESEEDFEWSDLVSNPEEYELNKTKKSKKEIIENRRINNPELQRLLEELKNDFLRERNILEKEFNQNKLTTLLINIVENKDDYLSKKII